MSARVTEIISGYYPGDLDQNKFRKVHFPIWPYRESNLGPTHPTRTKQPVKLPKSLVVGRNLVDTIYILEQFKYNSSNSSPLFFMNKSYSARYLKKNIE